MNNELEKMAKIIGSIVLSVFIVAVPIFCGFSYGINMNNLVKFFLTMVSAGEAVIVWVCIWTDIGG